jgi:4'-phosphopantetheinyl transferase EntD
MTNWDLIVVVTDHLYSPFTNDIAFACISSNNGEYPAISAQEEKCLSAKASQKRREQFALGRKAAREAMENLGIAAPGPVLRNESRQPIWPAGLVGSISHTDTIAVAAVTYPSRCESLGIDIHLIADQRLSNSKETLLDRICHESEATWVRSDQLLQLQRAALVFSAKESIFKALYPIYQSSIAFKDVELSWQDGEFEGTLLFDCSKRLVRGSTIVVKCLVDTKHVLTGVAIDAA